MNCLLKARAIAFGLEWVFPSKAIAMSGSISPGDFAHSMLFCAPAPATENEGK